MATVAGRDLTGGLKNLPLWNEEDIVAIERVFLGLERPSLAVAVEYLLGRYGQGDSADLSPGLIGVPGGRAGRRLLELLVAEAERRDWLLTPPQIETLGHLPEQLYPAQRPLANELVQRLAWSRVLQRYDPQRLGELISVGPQEDELGWLEYGSLLRRLHTELAAEGLNFADVAQRGQAIELFAEQTRWQILSDLQHDYLALLDELQLWDVQTARRVAVERGECRLDKELILVGTVDLPGILCRMLDQVAEQVTVLVFAPQAWSDRFDAHGALLPSAWESVTVPIDEERIRIVDGPAEQADRVVRCLSEWGERFRPDQITVGLADAAIIPLVQRHLEPCEIACRSAAGKPMSQTRVMRLLAAVEFYLRIGGYPEFAALVRHPDMDAYLQRQGIGALWPDALDAYYNRHLQSRLEPGLLEPQDARTVATLLRHSRHLLAELQGPPRPLSEWGEPLRGLLRSVYGSCRWDQEDVADRRIVQTLRRIQDTLQQHEQTIPRGLQPVVTAADALRLLRESCQDQAVADPADPGAVELLGWLELALDDAPALVVCGVNEGFVPSSLNADPFLPDALRTQLGLQDNARRYARDAYALTTLIGNREHVELIAGRRSADGEPLIPSRLLLGTDGETLARRALRFFATPEPLDHLPPLSGGLRSHREQSDFPIPRPQRPDSPITALRVTAFRDYLACPYRFYLRHVVGLQVTDDMAEELDGAAFGSLLHEVLHEIGGGPEGNSTDPERLEALFEQALSRRVARLYGDDPLATVRVQIEQLRQRLQVFARIQAARAAEGWRIESTEIPDRRAEGAPFEVDGNVFRLRGRIDRIDVHPETGQRMIWDYKSSDSGKSPDQVHRKSGQWIDLQLPLYRHIARSLGIEGEIGLGYILLPKDTANVRFEAAEWTEAELEEADARARDVIRRIQKNHFWPPAYPPPLYSEDLSAICQDTVFDKPRVD